MNVTVNKPWLARLRRMYVHCLVGFIPAMLVKLSETSVQAAEKTTMHTSKIEAPLPYLAVVGAPPLRFLAPPVIAMPDPAERKAKSAGVNTSATAEAPQPAASSSAAASKTAPAVDKGAKQPDTSEPSIIKDELKPQVRPEQFLPFFQLPGPGSLPITPGEQPQLPPSTATYRQE